MREKLACERGLKTPNLNLCDKALNDYCGTYATAASQRQRERQRQSQLSAAAAVVHLRVCGAQNSRNSGESEKRNGRTLTCLRRLTHEQRDYTRARSQESRGEKERRKEKNRRDKKKRRRTRGRGALAFVATRLLSSLSPMPWMALLFGPTNVTPASASFAANTVFSERNP